MRYGVAGFGCCCAVLCCGFCWGFACLWGMVLVYRGSVAYLASEPGVDSTAIWQTRPAAGGKDYGNRGVGGEGGSSPCCAARPTSTVFCASPAEQLGTLQLLHRWRQGWLRLRIVRWRRWRWWLLRGSRCFRRYHRVRRQRSDRSWRTWQRLRQGLPLQAHRVIA